VTDLDLCYLSANEALAAFREHRLSPVELLQAQLARAEQVDGKINAFTDLYAEEALAQARDAEARYMRKDGHVRDLEGLTVAVKDETDIAGKRTTNGSLTLKDNIAVGNHPITERLIKAGAVIHARTATPEFSATYSTHSRLHGVTRNPWNPVYTPCGSSGGAAASLAAGMTTLATGSDIGGSIRGPAAMCGVVGYKPPYGRNPELPPWNLDMFCHEGPLTRQVADCALLQNVFSGHHPQDIATLREKLILPLSYPGIKGWRIAYAFHVGGGVVAADIKRNMIAALETLESLGAELHEVDLGWGGEVTTAAKAYLDHLFGHWLVEVCDRSPDLVCDYTKFYAERSRQSDTRQFVESLRVIGDMYRSFGPMIEEMDAFICPTVATTNVPADVNPWDNLDVDGTIIDADYGWSMMHPFNMLSRLPVLAVPTGLGDQGVPTGVQLVARAYDDMRVFQLGAALEGVAGRRVGNWTGTTPTRPLL
jgi:Asp-tRNA(Asn)/Glu-tRNA(Gln) amidotransferase A subunit family amidase